VGKSYKKVSAALTPEIQTFMEKTKKLWNYRPWAEMIRTAIAAGLKSQKTNAFLHSEK